MPNTRFYTAIVRTAELVINTYMYISILKCIRIYIYSVWTIHLLIYWIKSQRSKARRAPMQIVWDKPDVLLMPNQWNVSCLNEIFCTEKKVYSLARNITPTTWHLVHIAPQADRNLHKQWQPNYIVSVGFGSRFKKMPHKLKSRCIIPYQVQFCDSGNQLNIFDSLWKGMICCLTVTSHVNSPSMKSRGIHLRASSIY